MIYNNEAEHHLEYLTRAYGEMKNIFNCFSEHLKALSGNNGYGIVVDEASNTKVNVYYLDRRFCIDFTIIKQNDNQYFGKLSFAKHSDDQNMEVTLYNLYYDHNGNVKYKLQDEFTFLNMNNKFNCFHILINWLVEYFNGLEFTQPASY